LGEAHVEGALEWCGEDDCGQDFDHFQDKSHDDGAEDCGDECADGQRAGDSCGVSRPDSEWRAHGVGGAAHTAYDV
jgi:hypothetical protein